MKEPLMANLVLLFPNSVRIENVTLAMSAMLGNRIQTMETGDGTVCALRAGIVEFHSTPVTVFMVTMKIRDAKGKDHLSQYFFESDFDGRVLTIASTPLNITMARRLVDLFGGKLIYQDQVDYSIHKPDYKQPPYRHNRAQGNPGFQLLQQRLIAIQPITSDEIRSCQHMAADQTLIPGFES
jgi:hypothetical protein